MKYTHIVVELRQLALGSLLLFACGGEGERFLAVDLVTDFVPEVEFDAIDVRVTEPDAADSRSQEASADRSQDYVRGVRVGSFEGAPATAVVRVELRAQGTTLATRSVRAQVGGRVAVRVVINRACLGVECPGAGDSPEATVCLGSECVTEECASDPDSCNEATQCESDSQCSMPLADCAEARCVEGICLAASRADGCAPGEYCVPPLGCRESGPMTFDSGVDGGSDSGVDSGLDAGSDSGVDAGSDSGFDAGSDSGFDAASDGGFDAGSDGGFDADPADAGQDACPGGGAELCNATDEDCDGRIDEGACSGCTTSQFMGSSYLYCGQETNFATANGACISRGYHLVYINTPEENAHVESLAGLLDDIWLGMQRTGFDPYQWLDGSSLLYTNWISPPGLPIQPDDRCAIMYGTNGRWTNLFCTTTMPVYVCEIELP